MTQPDHLGPSLHSESSLEKRIVQAATQLDIDVSRETLERIYCYVENLQKWNRTYNLTAIRNLDEILVNHIFDCMAIIPEIGALTEGKPFKLVDVGSGAGLPGLVIAAWFPQAQIVCVDSVEKKT